MILPINVAPGFTLLFTEHGLWASTRDGWVRFGEKIEAVSSWVPSVDEGTWTEQLPVPLTLEVFRERMQAFVDECLPPSDHGLSGAIPLPPAEWQPPPIDETDWAEQNRKINDLLMRERR